MNQQERNAIIERCAAVVDQCNREGPYQAIAAARRIRALKDFTEEPRCVQRTLNQTCGHNPRKCVICGFEPDWRGNAAAAIGG
jgi:hypothetical protein